EAVSRPVPTAAVDPGAFGNIWACESSDGLTTLQLYRPWVAKRSPAHGPILTGQIKCACGVAEIAGDREGVVGQLQGARTSVTYCIEAGSTTVKSLGGAAAGREVHGAAVRDKRAASS